MNEQEIKEFKRSKAERITVYILFIALLLIFGAWLWKLVWLVIK